MQRYEKYKDSGIEWLGEIPEHWEVKRLATWFEERRMKVSDKDFEPLSVTKNGIVRQLDSAAKSDDGDNRKLVRRGDFVINSRSDRKGSSGLSNLDGSVSLINIVLKPKNIYGSFSNYLLKSNGFIEEFYRNGHGIVADLWTTRFDEMKFISLAIPPDHEQKAITKFLNDKCKKIDAAIGLKEQQIEKLKELRQITIHNAVTKGIIHSRGEAVKMKDSGVDWIGEIPAHWTVLSLKHLSRKIVDGAHFTPTYVDFGIPFLRVTDLSNSSTDRKIDWTNVKYIPEVEHKELIKRASAEKGDILLSKNGTIGLTRVIDWDEEFSFFVSLCLIKPTEKLSANYFEFFFNCPIVDRQINDGSSRTSVTNLHLEKIKELLIILPPLFEQKEIVAYLEEQTSKIDKAIAQKQEQIAKLKEYKQSLINEVVTGKLKVVD
ncbi:restriction endonuclease subunit S [Sphingobacterium thalpophilum]|uniref:restriction endonuclease subunit S n=1 Tax=Sphingobacterium thalpophilum TaxID=259 RepID=UPI002D76F31F|nr:restriction endonuclease subunit S [Sphingobacterium thalpophilum]